MTTEGIISAALTLSAAERLEMIEQLWGSLAAAPEAWELTDGQRGELDRRIAEMDANPDDGIPWEHVKAELHKPR